MAPRFAINRHRKAEEINRTKNKAGDKMTTETINAILIHSRDDVATVIAELVEGERAVFYKNEEIQQVPVVGTIPQYHKLAVRDIKKAEPLRKYGEIIGKATQDIPRGSHVHEHNLVSPAEYPEVGK